MSGNCGRDLVVLPLTDEDLADPARVDLTGLDADSTAGVLFALPNGARMTALNALRFPIRHAHQRDLSAWLQIDGPRLGLGGLDLAEPEAGRRARSAARALHDQLPELDGIRLTHSEHPTGSGFPDLSRAFLDEFAERTRFSGPRYRLEERLHELTDPTANPRTRIDFVQAHQDLAFRLLSNLATECRELFRADFAFAVEDRLIHSLMPPQFDTVLDLLRFTRLGPIVLESVTTPLQRAQVHALTRYSPQGVLIACGNRLLRPVAGEARLSLIVNWRAPLVSGAVSEFSNDLDEVAGAVEAHDLTFDLLTPEQMTTSEMTAAGGFQCQGHEYQLALYPWPTVHTRYQWRELNGYLEEGGHAVFLGPEPSHFTDGAMITDDKSKFTERTIEISSLAGWLAEWRTATTTEVESAPAPSATEPPSHLSPDVD